MKRWRGRRDWLYSDTEVSSSGALGAPAGAVCTAQGRGTNLSRAGQGEAKAVPALRSSSQAAAPVTAHCLTF